MFTAKMKNVRRRAAVNAFKFNQMSGEDVKMSGAAQKTSCTLLRGWSFITGSRGVRRKVKPHLSQAAKSATPDNPVCIMWLLIYYS